MPDQYGNPTESELRNRAPDQVVSYAPSLQAMADTKAAIKARAVAPQPAPGSPGYSNGNTFAGTNKQAMSDAAYKLVSNNGTRAIATDRDVLGGGKYGFRGWANKHPVGMIALAIAAAAGGAAAVGGVGAGGGAAGGAGAGGGFGSAGAASGALGADGVVSGLGAGAGVAGGGSATGGVLGAGGLSSVSWGDVAKEVVKNIPTDIGGGGGKKPAPAGQPSSSAASPQLSIALSPRMRARIARRPHDMSARIARRNAEVGVSS